MDGRENTMEAFRAAADLGLEWVETDVHTTSDGVVVAFHDSTLDRVTDTSGDISEHTWAELQEVRIGGEEHIPTLEELLVELPHMQVNIDVKDEASVATVARVIENAGASHRVRLTSFSEARRRRSVILLELLSGHPVRTSAGGVGSGQLALLSKVARVSDRVSPKIAEWAWKAMSWVSADKVLAFDTVQVPVSWLVPLPGGLKLPVSVVTPDFVRFAHRLGIQVHVWTINHADEMHRLLDMGVDGLVTDRADLLVEVLKERDQWKSTAGSNL